MTNLEKKTITKQELINFNKLPTHLKSISFKDAIPHYNYESIEKLWLNMHHSLESRSSILSEVLSKIKFSDTKILELILGDEKKVSHHKFINIMFNKAQDNPDIYFFIFKNFSLSNADISTIVKEVFLEEKLEKLNWLIENYIHPEIFNFEILRTIIQVNHQNQEIFSNLIYNHFSKLNKEALSFIDKKIDGIKFYDRNKQLIQGIFSDEKKVSFLGYLKNLKIAIDKESLDLSLEKKTNNPVKRKINKV